MPALTQHDQAALEEKFRTRISPFVRRHVSTLPAEDAAALLRQFTPAAAELTDPQGFSDDPLHEDDADIHPFGDVVHKYRSKILYLTTDECPVYCRYCTRKRRTLLSLGHSVTPLSQILAYLQERPFVNEVIFSGGDPLMLPVADLFARAAAFLEIDSVHFLRFHTRALTTAPGLLSEKFFDRLTALRREYADKHWNFVLHINTAAEISAETRHLVQKLAALGIRCYAQTVLLRGINDSSAKLASLCQELMHGGIQPYYLHQLDRVTGSAHFEVPDAEARLIWNDLKNLVPVYMLPRLVRDSKQGKYAL